MSPIPTPFPVDPGWFEAYWLTEPPPRRRLLRKALQRLAAGLTALRDAPHSPPSIPVLACQTPSALVRLPPI